MAVYEMPGLKETTHAQLGVLAGPASGDCGPAVEEDQYKAEPPPWVGPKMGSIHGGSGDELHPGALGSMIVFSSAIVGILQSQ